MPRPRSAPRSSDDGAMSNAELARIFGEIADMLEILGEVVYKSVAYRRVADAIERYPDDVASLFRRGTPPKLPGAGPPLSQQLAGPPAAGSPRSAGARAKARGAGRDGRPGLPRQAAGPGA